MAILHALFDQAHHQEIGCDRELHAVGSSPEKSPKTCMPTASSRPAIKAAATPTKMSDHRSPTGSLSIGWSQ